MAMVMLSANALKSITGTKDVAGAILLDLARAFIASGFWEQFGAGDGVATFVTNTTNIFTSNGGLGYKTAGNWNTPTANSFSNPLAWICIRELGAGGTPTGRMMAFQRGSGSALGNDRFNVMAFAKAGWSGTPSATAMYPTGTYYSMWEPGSAATLGSAGHNIVSGGSAYLGGSAGTITNYNIWVPGSLSTGNVAPGGAEWTQGTAQQGVLFYEAVRCAPADTEPWITLGDTDPFGGVTMGSGTTAWNSTTAPIYGYDKTGTKARLVFNGLTDGNGSTHPPTNTAQATEFGGTYPIFPCRVSLKVSSPGAQFKGVCENFEQILLGGTSWMNRATFHAAVAAAEPARLSLGNTCLPWAVGLGAVPSTPGNRTDVRSAQPFSVVDSTAPVIGTLSPAAGAISATQAITIPITDAAPGLLARVQIDVDYSSPDRKDVAFNGLSSVAGYDGDYDASSTVSAITDGYQYVVVPDAGWRGAMTIRVTATDVAGNVTTSATAYTQTVSNVPTTTSVTPADASSVAYNVSPTFRNSAPTGMLRELIWAYFPTSGVRELIYASSVGFQGLYSTSGRAVVLASKTFDYTIVRTGGFPENPTFVSECVNIDAISSSTTWSYTITGANPAAPDAADPVVSSVLPAAGAVSPSQAITGQVTDDKMLARYTISVLFTTLQLEETVWDGTAYTAKYSAGSSRASIDAKGGYSFSAVRTEGWIDAFTFKVKPVDAAGKVADFSRAYTVNTTVDPNISDISPAPGGAFSPSTTVSFKLRAPAGAAFMVVFAKFENLDRTEVIWTGSAFGENYGGGLSTMTPSGVLGGDFVVRRLDGWPEVPIFETKIVDKYGRAA